MAKRTKRERAQARRELSVELQGRLLHAEFRLLRLAAHGNPEAIRYFVHDVVEGHVPGAEIAADTAAEITKWAAGGLEGPMALQALALFEPDDWIARMRVLSEELPTGGPSPDARESE